VLVDAGVRVIETWRQKASDDNPDIGEVGSNRTLLDVVARTAATATLHDHPVAGVEDVEGGLLHAMRGRIRARSGDSFDQNERRVREFVAANLEPALKRSSGVFWCRFYRGVLKENKADGEAVVSEGRRLKNDPALLDAVDKPGAEFPKFRAFTSYVGERGRRPSGVRPVDAAVRTFELLERYSLFTCAEEDADDDARL
jgi:hypothetical protein